MGKTNTFHFAFALLLSCSVVSLAIPKSNYTDEDALLAFKPHITSDPFQIITTNWSSSTPFCHWIGVTCSARHRRVAALDLSNLNLEGTIPPHIGNLSFLVSLNLRNNSFHGQLPTELANLWRLKSLDLENNTLNGSIPSSFGDLPLLEELILANNGLIGAIPSTLFNISKLMILVLQGNFLQGNIPRKIGNHSNLQHLWLGYNFLSGDVPLVLFNMSSLQFISLKSNNFTGALGEDLCNDHSDKLEWISLEINQLYGPIPSNFYMCKNLRILGLSLNKLTGSIPRQIGNVGKLEELYLGDNNLTGAIPREIGNLTELKLLSLESNDLTGAIPREIGNLIRLEELYIHGNQLTGTIPSTLFNLSTLSQMDLDSNYLSGRLLLTIGLWVPNIEYLFLDNNQLSGQIPNSICNASQLVLLDLSSNFFSSFIPDCLGNLGKLNVLFLGDNNLTSRKLNFLSSLENCHHLKEIYLSYNPNLNINLSISFGNLSSLTRLEVSNCTVKGHIPLEIANLSNLIMLNMNYNQLNGSIPSSIGKLESLQGLSLEFNRLEGTIPPEICYLKSLSYLHLGRNKLSRSIPACINNLTSLRDLHLNLNKLNSKIPYSLWDIKDLLVLNLSSNSLWGSISLEISNLKVLIDLDFSSNNLSGDIPTSIGGLQNLQSLYLYENMIQGNIPESMGNLMSLKSLDFSRNNLSGVIPQSMERLKYLEDFNVSFNLLEGEIPKGGPFARFNAQSFLGNEELCSSTIMNISPCKGNNPSHKKVTKFLLKCIVPILASLCLLSLAFTILYSRKCRRNENSVEEPKFFQRRRISYYELECATDGFAEVNLLGIGSFGSVFKGTLSDGKNVAIKVFNLQLEEAFKSFDTECQVFQNLRHQNLVKIITCCSSPNFKALVMDFMPNWSLEIWLYSHNYFLNLFQRLNIMLDVAFALEYLHHEYDALVVHCDIKPGNILLDEDMVAHVSDFGITKLLGEGNSITHTMTLATIGYMAPEYGIQGIVSTKGDVYSYGILLMETFTRKKPTDELFVGDFSLRTWVEQYVPHAITQISDPNLLSRDQEEPYEAMNTCMVSIFELALQCSANLPGERMNMKDVVVTLQKIKNKLFKDVEQPLPQL